MSDPVDLGEARRERAVFGSELRPRDALVNALADLDAGHISPSHVVVAWYDDKGTGFYQAGTASNVTVTGILHRVIDLVWRGR